VPVVRLRVRMKYHTSLVHELWIDAGYSQDEFNTLLQTRVRTDTQCGLKMYAPQTQRMKISNNGEVSFYYDAEAPNERALQDAGSAGRRSTYVSVKKTFPVSQELLDELEM
jgi:hypothetical protein